MTSLALLVPGSIDQLTGGYLYAKHLVAGLRARGRDVAVCELAGAFPTADATARAAAASALAALPDDSIAVLDGLALDGFADCLAAAARRLQLIAFVHHPLAAETGLDDAGRQRFAALEARLLPLCRGAICPSDRTAAALARYGVRRIEVAPPGTMKPARLPERAARGAPWRLLSVGTVTPRKGHRVLIEALSLIAARPWRLSIIGSLARDEGCVGDLRRAIAGHGLDARVTLAGEWPPERLASAYEAADIFALASYHEGYGMALAEALACGLPIVATDAGAIPDTVPASAGILVAPGDARALATALASLMDDGALRLRLAAGAAAAGGALPDWPAAVRDWETAAWRLLA